MKHKKVEISQEVSKFEIFMKALPLSFSMWVDKLDCAKSSSRERVDVSFEEVLNKCIADSRSHWTILYRDKVFDDDIVHWEFGMSGGGEVSYFIWMKLGLKDAQIIFDKYDFALEIIEY